MAKPSSTSKVAKVARTSSNPTRGRPKVAFPAAIFLVVLFGSLFVAYGRSERTQSAASAEAPRLGDHWHSAWGTFVCDSFLPPPTDAGADAFGIHTHNDGLIHIHPFSTSVTGEGATIEAFAEQVGWEIGSDSFTTADGTTYENGFECDGEPAEVQLVRWATPSAEDPAEIITTGIGGARFLEDGEVFTLAVVPAGTTVPKPPSTGSLADVSDDINYDDVPPQEIDLGEVDLEVPFEDLTPEQIEQLEELERQGASGDDADS